MLKWREVYDSGKINHWLWFILAAISFSLAILGRQIYVVLTPLMFLLMTSTWPSDPRKWKYEWILTSVFSIVSLALPAYIFYTWEGFTSIYDAKIYASIAERGTSFVPVHFFFSLGYMTIIALLIAPNWFEPLWKPVHRKKVIILGVLIIAGNLLVGFVEYLAMEGTVKNFLSGFYLSYYGRFIGGGLIVSACAFLATACIHGLHNFSDRLFLLSLLACLGIAFTSIKITHQFSSRYVAQAAPFLIIIFARFPAKDLWNPIGKAIGVIIGLVSLYSYFYID